MILSPQALRRYKQQGTRHYMGGGGGSSSSQQSTDTSTQLTNNVTSTDSRSVASDHAIALGGTGDSVTQNTSNAASYADSGNTTTNFKSGSDNTSTTNFASTDSHDASTAFASNVGNTNTNTNSGNTSTAFSSTTNNTVSDFGSVQAALNGMQTTASQAMGITGNIAGNAVTALSMQSANTMGLMGDMFKFASASGANSQGTAMQALGLANNATAQANLASSDSAANAAKDKKMMEYALVAGAVLLVFLTMKK